MHNPRFRIDLNSLRLAEQTGAGGIDSYQSFFQAEFKPRAVTAKGRASFAKNKKPNLLKALPLIGFGSLLVGMVVLIVFLATPGLLINHFVQTLTDRFNYQAPSFEARSNMLLNNKWLDKRPTSKFRLINDYRKIPEQLVKSLEKEGLLVKTDNGRITQVFYKNQEIPRQQFLHMLQNNIDINQAKNDSFNANRAMFRDSVWSKTASNFGLSKRGFDKPKSNNGQDIFDDFKKQELSITKVQEPQTRFATEVPTRTDENGNVHEQSSPSIDIFRGIRENLKYINRQADEVNKSQQTPYGKSFNKLKLVETSFVNNQSACGLHHNGRFLQNYAKNQQAKQQAQLALNLFVESEKIKAGVATPESVAFYGDRLTRTSIITKADGTKVETLSATDSQGYKYAAYGDTVKLNESAERYVLGSNPSLAQAQKSLGDVSTKCDGGNFIARFFSSILANIANLLRPFRLNIDFLNQLLDSGKDRQMTENTIAAMANMKVAPDTSGEDLGNAITAGAGFFLGKNAVTSGNAILTKKQATAYLAEQNKYLAMQGEIDRRKLSPFDPSSRHTLMGSLIASNLHLFRHFSSIRTFFQSWLKSSQLALARLNPVTQASTNRYVNHNRCQDSEFLKLNRHLNGEEVAFDIFCNPIYGTDVSTLKLDPEEVINRLIKSGDLVKTDANCQTNCELKPAKGLEKYQKNCIDRAKTPIGDDNKDLGLDDGESCLANSSQKSLYAVYFIDQRLQAIFNSVQSS